MQITDIISIDKKRCKVYIDGEFMFVLYKGELRNYRIKQGNEIGASVVDEITQILIPKRCTKRAMNLLQKKDYTTNQLKDKLREGLYSEDAIEAAIAYVSSYHYLDDERYTRDYITYHMENRSRNRIIQDLTSKGLSKDFIIPILDELYSETDSDIELTQIRQLLEKKHYNPETSDYKEKQKIIAFLMRRGFSMSDIRKAISCDELI